MNLKKVSITIIIFLLFILVPVISKATDYVVALDAGHGGGTEDISWFESINGDSWNYDNWGTNADYDNTREGIVNFSEAAWTKKTVMYMIEYLKQYDNIRVIVCPRTGDGHYSDRPFYARDNNADVHLSVHYNAGGGEAKGTLTEHKEGDSTSQGFAQTILDSVTEATGLEKRGVYTDSALGNTVSIMQPSSEMGCPSIILECAFYDNDEDLLFISEESNVKKIAAGAVSGILAYLGVEDKGYPDIPDYDGYSGSGSTTSNSSNMEITSNEDKFLGLWKNATGVYEPYYNDDGTINELALFDRDGTEVTYSQTEESVAYSIINASGWFFSLLENSERTQNHLTIMKYLMNVYTDSNMFGDIDFEKDIASMFASSTEFNSVTGIYGGTIQEKVWFALRDAGYSEEATAGVMGNIQQESSFNATSVNSSSGASGMCQWLGGRKDGLVAYASSKGVDWTDENTQIEYLIGEITEGGGADGYATYQLMSTHGYSPSDWVNATTPEDAAVAFCWTFERPGDAEANLTNRQNAAREYYNEFHGRTKPSGGGTYNESSDDSRVNGYYTSSSGKTFTILNQNRIDGWGSKCNRAASAIIASGYSDQSADELINYMNNNYDGAYFDAIPSNGYWNAYGLEVTSTSGTSTNDYMNSLKNQLSSGGYALFWLNCGGTYYGKSGIQWTSQYHWIAIIDYKNENGTDKICVADWHGINWVDIDEFSSNGVAEIVYVNEN